MLPHLLGIAPGTKIPLRATGKSTPATHYCLARDELAKKIVVLITAENAHGFSHDAENHYRMHRRSLYIYFFFPRLLYSLEHQAMWGKIEEMSVRF